METLAALPELLNKRHTLARHRDLKQEVNSNSVKATSVKESLDLCAGSLISTPLFHAEHSCAALLLDTVCGFTTNQSKS